jgi:DNA-binding CsgD family transcriptional regulator
MQTLAKQLEERIYGEWKHCVIRDEELERIWPINEENREEKIAQFARKYGFRLKFYQKGTCAVFDKWAPEPRRTCHEDFCSRDPLGSLGLTPRETEVLTLIAQGKTNDEIGVIVGASTRTIGTHVGRILIKLRVKNRTAAAAIALATLAKAKDLAGPASRITEHSSL